MEFLHPACLDTLSSLPCLTHLTISNPSIIGELGYSGPISEQLLMMFTQHSPCLCSFIVKSEHSVLEPSCLGALSSTPRPNIEMLLIEVTVATRGEDWIREMQRVLNVANNLTCIGNTERWDNVNPDCVQDLKRFVTDKRWALSIL